MREKSKLRKKERRESKGVEIRIGEEWRGNGGTGEEWRDKGREKRNKWVK